VVPESDESVQFFSLVGGRFLGQYLTHACSRVAIFDLDGNHEGDVELPGLGSVVGFAGKADDPETFFLFHGFTHAPSVFRYDVATGESTLWKAPRVDFDPDAFEVKQVFYASKDGTQIPMFIVHRKGIELNGTNPVYMSGYGGFGIPTTPMFSVSYLAWVEQGGVLAISNMRGGAEYGEEWHRAGMRANKQNVFDDFIAAGEWLVANGYTSPEHLGISGGSNGGLLVGAALTQRPDLFASVVCSAPLLDMIRYEQFSIGRTWNDEYGTADDATEIEWLLSYSPYHHTKEGTDYPAVLFTSFDSDSRTDPCHARKMAAALQHDTSSTRPILFRREAKVGHSSRSITRTIDLSVDTFTWNAAQLGLDLAD
jgi:prolyl oligopeptidase